MPWSRPLKTAGIALTSSGAGVMVVGLLTLALESLTTRLVGVAVGSQQRVYPGQIAAYALIGVGAINLAAGVTSLIIAVVARRDANATLMLAAAADGVGVRI